MATLVAIAYTGEPDRAAMAAKTLEGLPFATDLDLNDAVAVVVTHEGKAHLFQSTNLTTLGVLDGALIGLVTGIVLTFPFPFIAPLAAAGAALSASAIGGVTGGAIGHYTEMGIDDDFVRDLSAKLPPDSSALFVLVEADDDGRVLSELVACGGELFSTHLPDDVTSRVREHLRKERQEEEV